MSLKPTDTSYSTRLFLKKNLVRNFNTLTRIFKVLCEYELQKEAMGDRVQRFTLAGDGSSHLPAMGVVLLRSIWDVFIQ